MSLRIAYVTTDPKLLAEARRHAADDGHVVFLLPPDAPLPEPGAVDGVLIDLRPIARHASARKELLDRVSRLARSTPVAAHDLGLAWWEAKSLRAAGVRAYPGYRAKMLSDLAGMATGGYARKPETVARAGAPEAADEPAHTTRP